MGADLGASVADLQCPLAPRPEGLEEDRGLPVEARALIGVGEAVDHRGDFSETQVGAIGPTQEDESLELPAPVGLPLGPEQDLTARGLHRASRKIQRRATHRPGHEVEAQTVPPQAALRDLDGDLEATDPGEPRLRNVVHGSQVVPDLLRQVLQGLLGHVSVEHQGDHLGAIRDLGYDRLLGLRRKGLDAVDFEDVDIVLSLVGNRGLDYLPRGTGARREAWDITDPFGEDDEVYFVVARDLERRIRALLSSELDSELFPA